MVYSQESKGSQIVVGIQHCRVLEDQKACFSFPCHAEQLVSGHKCGDIATVGRILSTSLAGIILFAVRRSEPKRIIKILWL